METLHVPFLGVRLFSTPQHQQTSRWNLHEEGDKHKVWLRNGPSMKSKGMLRVFFVKKGKDADKKAELPLVSQFVYI